MSGGRDILLIVRTTREAQPLLTCLRDRATATVVDAWHVGLDRVASRHPPAALVVSGTVLSAELADGLRSLNRIGRLVPVGVFVEPVSAETVEAVDALYPLRPALLFDGKDLPARLERLLAGEHRAVVDFIAHASGSCDGLARTFLHALAGGGGVLHSSAAEAARAVHASRSTLYLALARAGLPGVEQCQALFRLLPAVGLLRDGARAEEAAWHGGFADQTTLRRALRTRVGLTLEEARRSVGWREVAASWLLIHGLAPPGAPETQHPLDAPHSHTDIQEPVRSPTIAGGYVA